MLAGVAVLLRLAGFVRCRRFCERRGRGAGPATAADLELARAWDRALRIAAHNLPGAHGLVGAHSLLGAHGLLTANCLERSLALCWLLHRRGIDAELRLGVRRDPEDLAAHAWVEIGGRALDPSSDRYAAFATGPG